MAFYEPFLIEVPAEDIWLLVLPSRDDKGVISFANRIDCERGMGCLRYPLETDVLMTKAGINRAYQSFARKLLMSHASGTGLVVLFVHGTESSYLRTRDPSND